MAERKSQNKYMPPEYDPQIHGSLNKYRNRHKHTAPKQKQAGVVKHTTVRFEMPFPIWCDGCSSHIGMGVRYNAKKREIGEYFTTIIWSFSFKCHLCPQEIEIRTDPANAAYIVYSGARKKLEPTNYEEGKLVEQERARMHADPLFKCLQ